MLLYRGVELIFWSAGVYLHDLFHISVAFNKRVAIFFLKVLEPTIRIGTNVLALREVLYFAHS